MNSFLTSNNIRLLELTFDDKLSWRPHQKKLKTECSSRMEILKVPGNNTWGSEIKRSLVTIYKSLILSLTDYGAIIYYSAKNNVLNTINPIHNQRIHLALELPLEL